ncbi:MAG TPA: hypothetical protein PKV72_00010 [Candidatus Peribacteria bacterium]|nr:hypothetical protein [Candidatus Peribacteria bacterium]
MKRASLAIGLLTLLMPLAAHADALSPWTQQVIDRIQMGMDTADSFASGGTCDPDKEDGYLAESETAIRRFIDVREQISRHNAFLKENTLCLQSDLDLLEDKINDLRVAIVDADTACNLKSMRVLTNVVEFAVQAYNLLVVGGNDPSVKDDLLRYEYFWESADLVNSGSGTALNDVHEDAAQCPYTTDYSPHAIGYVQTDGGPVTPGADDLKSYGCDAETIGNIAVHTQEMDGMDRFLNGDGGDNEGTLDFIKNISTIVTTFSTNIDTTIANLRGTGSTTPYPPPLANPPPHDKVSGCLRPQVPLVAINPGDTMPDSMLDDYPDYYSADNAREVQIAPGVFFQTFNPPPEEALPIGAFLRPAYDYFSIFSNPVNMQRRFTAKKTVIGYARPLTLDAQGLGPEVPTSLYLLIYGIDAPSQYRTISASIDRETGFIEAASRDGIERTLQAYAPLQGAITKLSEVTDKELPAYIQDFGYFMLRQCADGHCSAVNGTLDTMEKRIYNPSCHPYVSGDYTDARTHIKCLCIPKSNEEPDGLDVAACDCGGTPQAGDCQTWCAYCQEDPSQAERDKYADMEPELYPGCRVEQGDPDSGY